MYAVSQYRYWRGPRCTLSLGSYWYRRGPTSTVSRYWPGPTCAVSPDRYWHGPMCAVSLGQCQRGPTFAVSLVPFPARLPCGRCLRSSAGTSMAPHARCLWAGAGTGTVPRERCACAGAGTHAILTCVVLLALLLARSHVCGVPGLVLVLVLARSHVHGVPSPVLVLAQSHMHSVSGPVPVPAWSNVRGVAGVSTSTLVPRAWCALAGTSTGEISHVWCYQCCCWYQHGPTCTVSLGWYQYRPTCTVWRCRYLGPKCAVSPGQCRYRRGPTCAVWTVLVPVSWSHVHSVACNGADTLVPRLRCARDGTGTVPPARWSRCRYLGPTCAVCPLQGTHVEPRRWRRRMRGADTAAVTGLT